MADFVRVTIASSRPDLCLDAESVLWDKGIVVTRIQNKQGLLGSLYSDPPDVMLVDLSSEHEAGMSIICTLRNDLYFSTMPIIGLVGRIDAVPPDWGKCPLDDFISIPLDSDELFHRITLALSRIKRVFDNNPLTRLPGNTSIQRAIQDAIGKPLAVCYLDINQFKPYNDVYGFSHGDEVIRMLARIMYNAVRESGGGFCGHVGGDDFVCIVPLAHAEPICKTIIGNYDKIVLDLFDDKIKQQGCYISTNRKGEIEEIPLLSLSIAVVPTDTARITHFARVAEVAAELKALAKLSRKSSYIIDKRRC